MTPGGTLSPPPDASDDIAIVGMANVFPGSDHPARFWQNIVDRVDSITDPPPDWQPECFLDPSGTSDDRCYTGRGGYLGDLCRFDPLKHGTMPGSIEGAEPDHFIALRCAEAALADAGFPKTPLNTQATAVILGRGVFFNRGSLTWMLQGYLVDQVVNVVRQLLPDHPDEDYRLVARELRRNLPPFNADTVAGLTHSVLAGRIANRLNLNGPAYTTDAACASALVAVEHGMEMLRRRTCDAVIAGGVQVSTPGMVQLAFCYLKALSRNGRIAPFSADADGTLLGQGCGMIVLKRRSEAERDGNRIYALLKAVGLSSDGKGAGLLAPRQEGQELAVRRAYEQSRLDPATVGLIEAHATGIPLGDQTEIRTLTRCFGKRRGNLPTVAIGSVKSMISHLIPASGSAGLMKTALALYHRVLPPTLHAEKVNPALGLDESPFYPNTTTRPWIHGEPTPRRAAMNAFGFGGINAHAILEEYVPSNERALPRYERDWPAELVIVAAPDRPALITRAERLADWIEQAEGINLLDIAAASARETAGIPAPVQRAAIVATSLDDLAKKLRHLAKLLREPDRTRIQVRSGVFWFAEPLGRNGRVAWVFPGEGSQYVNMLSDLCRHFPEVRRQFDLTDRAFLSRRPRQTLSRLIFPLPHEETAAEENLLKLGGAVTSVTAASRALMALMNTLGLKPDAVVGHSSGEFGALMAAGAFPTEDEEKLIRDIAAGADSAAEMAASDLVPAGSLTAVGGIDREVVERVLAASDGRLTIAMDNCPHQLVLVGDEEATQSALTGLQGQGGLCQKIAWSRAYHTESFRPAARFVEKYYRSVGLRSPRVELWSCATAAKYPTNPEAALELAVRQWYSPVRFQQTISAMHDAGVRVFVEIGPRGNLSAFVNDTLHDRAHLAVALDAPKKGGVEQLCQALAMLTAHDVPLRVEALYARREPASLDINAPPVKKRIAPRLPLELPVLQVGQEAIERFARRETKDSRTDGSPPHESAPRPTPRPMPTNPPRTGTHAGATPQHAGAMLDFQKTMQQFLDVQKTVVEQMRNRTGGQTPRPTSRAVAPKSVAPAIEPPPQPVAERPRHAPQMPLLESILEHVPGTRLVAECELDLNRHAFLRDHTFFGGPVSTDDPGLVGLPVLPMAMMLEFAAEAASLLDHGRKPVAFTDVKTLRWVAFEKETRRIRVEAALRSDGDVDVRLLEADREGFSAEILTGIVECTDGPNPLGPPRVADRAKKPAPWASDLYGRTLYHGPSFAGIRRIERCDESGVRAVLTEATQPLTISGRSPEWVLPVALIDACSQVAGLVYGDWKPTDRHVHNVYPNGFDRLEIDPATDWQAEFTAVADVGREGRHFRSDFELTAADGRVVLRMLRRVDEIVDFPAWVYAAYRDPTGFRIVEERTHLFTDVVSDRSVTVCRLTREVPPILLKHPWIQVLAHLALDQEERRQFAAKKSPAGATLSWLIGRITAKDAVRARIGGNRCLADVRIDSKTSGQPVARVRGATAPLVSISHREKTALAAAADPRQFAGVGVDIEPRAQLADEVAADGFSDTERNVLKNAANALGEFFDDWMLAGWCAKEAAGKALGTGVLGSPRNLEIIDVEVARRAVRLRPHGPMMEAARKLSLPDAECQSWIRWDGDGIVALCLLNRTEGMGSKE